MVPRISTDYPIASIGDSHEQYLAVQKSIEGECKAAWEASPDIRLDFGNRFELYLAYRTAKAQGLVKILGDR